MNGNGNDRERKKDGGVAGWIVLAGLIAGGFALLTMRRRRPDAEAEADILEIPAGPYDRVGEEGEEPTAPADQIPPRDQPTRGGYVYDPEATRQLDRPDAVVARHPDTGQTIIVYAPSWNARVSPRTPQWYARHRCLRYRPACDAARRARAQHRGDGTPPEYWGQPEPQRGGGYTRR